MILHNGSAPVITAQVAQRYNGGLWTGASGITSSAAPLAGNTAIGVAPGATAFDGQTVTNTDVLVKYTYYGDANLDGQVNSTDYTMIDNSVNQDINTGWQNGDFNYDNNINGDDYSLIDNAFNTQNVAASQAATALRTVALTFAIHQSSNKVAVNSFLLADSLRHLSLNADSENADEEKVSTDSRRLALIYQNPSCRKT